MEKEVILPKRKIHKTPRLLVADAYTVGSDKFQSLDAKQKSVYYITFRRELFNINDTLFNKGDNRMIFGGIQRILEKLFYEPITHEEIDISIEFLSTFKVTNKGLSKYECPEHLWRIIVDEFNGRPPIKITAMPEGSVVYPNEPVVIIEATDNKFGHLIGELGAWFESKLLQTWAISERITRNEHWLSKLEGMVRSIDPYLTEEMVSFFASLMLTDFGDRAGITSEESEELGMAHLYTFPGTDTCSGAFQAWMNANKTPIGSSVNALAHRNVQAYEFEGDCYKAIYDSCGNDEIISMVADCYSFYDAVDDYLLPLALRSKYENNGKIVIARPDSGDPLEQVLYVCNLAEKNGLVTYREIDGKTWKFATYLKFIEGDGMTYDVMWDIIQALISEGFVPYSFGLFGVGGGLRNELKRDNFSAKYALSSKGLNDIPVTKFSETFGKTTLPGPFKVLRSKIALDKKQTVVHIDEDGEDAMVVYFDGSNIYKPFGPGQDDDFLTIRNRIKTQFNSMPLTLKTKNNHNYPASDKILEIRKLLLEKYAPNKDKNNY